MKKQLQLFSALLLVGAFINAQPIITGTSGTLSTGQNITITGSGFGTKSTQTPLVWDDFESGTPGVYITGQPAKIGTWLGGLNNDTSAFCMYSQANPHEGNQSAHLKMSNQLGQKRITTPFTKLYIDYWCQVHEVSGASRNWKMWALFDQPAYSRGIIPTFADCNSYMLVSIFDYPNSPTWWPSNFVPYTNTQYMHIQAEWKESTVNQADGELRLWQDGVLLGDHSGQNFRQPNSTRTINQIALGELWLKDATAPSCPPNGGAHLYIDNAYIDESWARVELGDLPIYDSCKHREIQIPSSWSVNSITTVINHGSFANCDTAYLFVTDENGVVNQNGYQVIINQPICAQGIANNTIIKNLSVSPNPNNGNFNISFDQQNAGDVIIEIANILGEKLYSEQLNSFSGRYNKNISIENYASGIYMLNLTTKENTITQKISKQ